MSSVTIDDAILLLPATHRAVVAELRTSHTMLLALRQTMQAEVATLQQRVKELEAQAVHGGPRTPVSNSSVGGAKGFGAGPSTGASAPTVADVVAGIRAQSQAAQDAARRRASDAIALRTADDSAVASLQLPKLPPPELLKKFATVDLFQLAEMLVPPVLKPTAPAPLGAVNDFLGHIDAVRQCVYDGRTATLLVDVWKEALVRKVLDLAQAVEARVAASGPLALPPQTVAYEAATQRERDDIPAFRADETRTHLAAIEGTGMVFERAAAVMADVEQMMGAVQSLPHFLPDYDMVAQELSGALEAIERQQEDVRASGERQVAATHSQRLEHLASAEYVQTQVAEKGREADKHFDDAAKSVQAGEDALRSQLVLVQQMCRAQADAALSDRRAADIQRGIENETQRLQKTIENVKLSAFLSSKSKELFCRMHISIEDAMRTRRDMCDRLRSVSQEQLYTMAENFHSVVSKRMVADNAAVRADQAALEVANRALMGLVHAPEELEKQTGVIRQLTVSIAATKERQHLNNADIGKIKEVLARYKTVAFLRRENTFLAQFEAQEHLQRLREKIDDATQRVKFVSELLVEVSDPDTRMDYVVEQCVDSLKAGVADIAGLAVPSVRMKIEELDESFRVQAAGRLKRHRRLVGHFLEELRDGSSTLAATEPGIETHVMMLLEGVDAVLAALTHTEMSGHGFASGMFGVGTPGTSGGGGFGNHHRDAYAHQHSQQQQQPSFQESGPSGMRSVSRSMFGGGAGTTMQGPGGANSMPRSISITTGAQPQFGELGSPSQAAGSPAGGPAFQREAEDAHHTFARASARLRLTAENRRVTKTSAAIEMSNTSALGMIGYRQGTGVFCFTIRVVQHCTRLLVGFADWNLPLDGYCNSLKYNGCYFLHLGNGTLWAPDLGMERRPYTYEAIGATPGSELRCILDTYERTISYTFGDINLGVAFRNVNMSRTLYPAFELFSNGCSVEFV